MFQVFTQIILLLVLGFAPNSWAISFIVDDHDRALCTQHLNKFEQLYNIPQNLLRSISIKETGNWPWSINVKGKPYFFANKDEAIKAVSYLVSVGINSIDVGCMQINLRHHPEAFNNLEEAFEPEFNIAYAAKFLRNNFDSVKDWKKATAHYHSKTLDQGNKYAQSVMKILKNHRYSNKPPTHLKPQTQLAKSDKNKMSHPIKFSPEANKRIASPMIIAQTHKDASRYLFQNRE